MTVAEAEAARRKHLADLDDIRVVPLRRGAAEVTAKLHECNLISGIADAAA